MKLRKISILNVYGIILLMCSMFLLISLDKNGISAANDSIANSTSYDSTLLFVDNIT